MFSPAFLGILLCLVSAPVEFSLHVKQKAMTKCRVCKINTFIQMDSEWDEPSSSSKPSRIQLNFAFPDAILGSSAYLEQLHSDTSKHELQQSCNNHDITNSSNGHKDTLNNMLERKRKKKKELYFNTPCYLGSLNAYCKSLFYHIQIMFLKLLVLCCQ